MTLKEVYDTALKHINTYSQNGALITGTRIADYAAQRIRFTNEAMADLAAKLGFPEKHTIVHKPIQPQNTGTGGFVLTQHVNDDIILLTAVGSRAYTIDVNGTGSIYIEEETSEGVWGILTTINAAVTTQTNFKGVITPSDLAHNVRIRLGGSYPYDVMNFALYDVLWASNAKVQEWKGEFEYSMPSDFLRFDTVANQKSTFFIVGGRIDYYRHMDTVKIPYSESGIYDLYYFKKPEFLPDNATDASVLDIPMEVEEAVPFYVAMQFVKNQRPQVFAVLAQLYANFTENGDVKQDSTAQTKLRLPNAFSTRER